MRIDFPRSERSGVNWSGDALHIGSAAHQAVCLKGAGIAAEHAVLTSGEMGIWLRVCPGAGRVYVNARPVREWALIRLGDTLSIGGHRLLLRVAESPPVNEAGPHDHARSACAAALPAVSLRAVAGASSGQTWSVHDQLRLGRSGRPVLATNTSEEIALAVHWRGHELWLETRAGASEVVSINGMAVAGCARLHNADCIGLGAQRFVVDAWALTQDAHGTDDPVDPAADAGSAQDSAGPRGEVWWLILTAAGLGLLIALLLLLRL